MIVTWQSDIANAKESAIPVCDKPYHTNKSLEREGDWRFAGNHYNPTITWNAWHSPIIPKWAYRFMLSLPLDLTYVKEYNIFIYISKNLLPIQLQLNNIWYFILNKEKNCIGYLICTGNIIYNNPDITNYSFKRQFSNCSTLPFYFFTSNVARHKHVKSITYVLFKNNSACEHAIKVWCK